MRVFLSPLRTRLTLIAVAMVAAGAAIVTRNPADGFSSLHFDAVKKTLATLDADDRIKLALGEKVKFYSTIQGQRMEQEIDGAVQPVSIICPANSTDINHIATAHQLRHYRDGYGQKLRDGRCAAIGVKGPTP